jgi:hypothetical protein
MYTVPDNTVSSDPFAKLHALDVGLANDVRNLIDNLEKRKAQDGAKRLAVVAQKFDDFTVEGAYQYIKKDEIILELEERGVWWLSALYFVRDLLSIAPIAFTWLALHLAASAYQQDLADPRYKQDLYQPFLFLWQESFHSNHGTVIQFSWAAFWDATLLALLIVIFVGVVPLAKWFHRKIIYQSLGKDGFDGVIDNLLVMIGKYGANTFLSDSDTKKIASVVAVTMNDFLIRFEQALDRVLLNYDRVTIESRKYIEDTKEQTEALVKAFHQDLGVFNADVRLLTADLGRMKTSLENFDQQVQDLTGVNKSLAHSSDELAKSAKELVSSANLNVTVCGGIENRLGELNLAQQAIVKTQLEVAETIKKSQEDIAQKLDTTQEKVYQEIVKAQKEVVQEVTTAQQKVVQEMGENEKQVYQEIVKTQKEVIQEVTTAQQTIVHKVTDSQEKVVQKITDSQKDVVDEMIGVADVVERSSKDTRDASLNLERVANNLEQLTRADFQKMTDGVMKSNQDLVKEVQKTVSEMTEVTDKVEEFATQLGKVNQPAQALADAAKQLSQIANKKPWWQLW